MEKTYFPVKIRMVDSYEVKIVNDPEELPNDETFVVLATNVDPLYDRLIEIKQLLLDSASMPHPLDAKHYLNSALAQLDKLIKENGHQ